MPITRDSARLSITSTPAQMLLLAAWGVWYGLSFPRPNLWPLAHLAVAPLTLLAVRGEPAKRVLGLSYVLAVAWWCAMLAWLTQVTVAGYLALGVYLALYTPLYVAVIRFCSRRMHVPLVLGVPVVWVACEYLRGLMLTGFPWFSLGHSQPTAMIQVADFSGAYGVSFVVAMTSGLICDLLTNPLLRPIAGRLRMGRVVLTSLVVWIMVMGGTLIYGAWRIAEYHATDDDLPTLAVTLVQTDVEQSNKIAPTLEAERAGFNRAVALTKSAAEGADLAVWPETMVPGSLNDRSMRISAWAEAEAAKMQAAGEADAPQTRPRYDWLRRAAEYRAYRRKLEALAAHRSTALVVGSHTTIGWGTDDRRDYNSAYFFDAAGHLRGRYDKMHRVPFGEYIPFADIPWVQNVLIRLTPYDYNYSLSAGRRIAVFEVPVGLGDGAAPRHPPLRLATPICFEDVISHVCRNMVYGEDGRKRVDMLVNLTNDGWYPGWAQGPQHEQIARFRCVENRVPMARAVNRGVSSFIDSCGRVIGRVEVAGRTQRVRGTATAELRPDPRRTLFGRVGDAFAVVCGLVTVLGVAASALVRRPRRQPQ